MGNPMCPESEKEVKKADALICTHGHCDHIGDAVAIVKQHQPTSRRHLRAVPLAAEEGRQEHRSHEQGRHANGCRHQDHHGHAVHSCGIMEDDGSIVYGGEACGYVLELPGGVKLYHAGDTAVFGDMPIIRELYAPEIAMLPIGDHFTMSPREAAYACGLLQPKIRHPYALRNISCRWLGGLRDLTDAAGRRRSRGRGDEAGADAADDGADNDHRSTRRELSLRRAARAQRRFAGDGAPGEGSAISRSSVRRSARLLFQYARLINAQNDLRDGLGHWILDHLVGDGRRRRRQGALHRRQREERQRGARLFPAGRPGRPHRGTRRRRAGFLSRAAKSSSTSSSATSISTTIRAPLA